MRPRRPSHALDRLWSASGSYSIDGTIRTQAFDTGKLPRGLQDSGAGYSRDAVNGTWSDQGTTRAPRVGVAGHG